MSRLLFSILFCISFFGFSISANADMHNPALSFDNIGHDYDAFYNKDRMLRMGGAFLLMSAFANSEADQNIQDWYRENVESHKTNGFSPKVKEFGEKKYVVPASLGLSYYQSQDRDSSIGQFGANTARAYLVGTPAMLLMQKVTGGSRPDERERYNNKSASQWRFFNDNNGVSGHAFMGAVPFLTLAKMNKDNDAIRVAALLASTLTAWSRVNDGSHYFSQAVLGWYMAYESVDAVFEVNESLSNSNKSSVNFSARPNEPMLFQIGISKEW